jgi:hypothetical protein
VGKTTNLLKKNEVFEKDKTIDNAYQQAKFYFDKLHQRFIEKSLQNIKLDFSEYEKLFFKKRELQRQKNNSKEIQNKTKKLYREMDKLRIQIAGGKIDKKEIIGKFNETGEEWKKDYQGKELGFNKSDLKQKGYNFILSSGVLKILKYEFPKKKDQEFQNEGYPSLFIRESEGSRNQVYIFDKFDGFIGYLDKFQKTRENMYSEKADGTAIANRIINENLQKFLENKIHFKELGKENVDFSKEIEVDLKGKTLNDIFSLEFYNQCLLQDDINFYNKIIGGETKELENGEKQSFKGLNQIINEYRQQHKNDEDFLKSKFYLFKLLDKQILGEIEKEKQLIEVDENGKDNLFDRLKEFIKENKLKIKEADVLFKDFTRGEYNEELGKIYISSKAINTISRKWFQDSYAFEILLPQKSKKDEKGIVKLKDFISILEIKNVLNDEIKSKDIYKKDYQDCIDEQKTNFEKFITIWNRELESLFKDEINKAKKVKRIGYQNALREVEKLSKDFDSKDSKNIEIIKNYADASLRIFQMMKYFALEKEKKKNPENLEAGDFYVEFEKYYNDYQIIKYYNAFRNFLTKKPYSENKIKLNFEKGNLLGGWAESPKGNAQFNAYILRKNQSYFLGVTNFSKVLDTNNAKKYSDEIKNISNGYYEKMNYKQLKSTSIYGSSYEKRYKSKYAGDKNQYSDKELIKRIKEILKLQVKYFPNLKKFINKNYRNKNDLAKDLGNEQFYNINFDEKVSLDYVEKGRYKINRGEKYLYLFQIYNKDFSKDRGEKSKNKKENLHTSYFKMLFDKNNFKKSLFKLSGGGEIFFRPSSIEKIKEKRNFPKEIIRNKRYSDDKYLFHFPIKINSGKGKKGNREFNQETNQKLFKQIDDINIIGIDRGEKHLAYYSVINQNGEIIDQGSFNKINGHDYHKKLDEREKERMDARKSWKSIRNIRELKQGYISQVVRKIADLIIEYNAIVVFEDLNFGFKQGRQKIEKQIYQKLEEALIKKLNFLVNKGEEDPEKSGHLLKAYQLAAPFTTFKDMGKQTGVIFYTTAGYTSTTDPLTGWRKNIYISNSLPIDEPRKGNGKYIKGEIQKFKKIAWDEEKQSYFFEYVPKDFGKSEISKTQTIYANVTRLQGRKNDSGYWEIKPVNPNNLLKDLFQKFNFKLKGDIKKQIEKKEGDGELIENKELDGEKRNFYKSLVYYLNLILQIRNSSSARWIENEKEEIKKEGKEADFIQSPVYPFFATKCKDYNVEENFAGFEEKIILNNKNKKRILEEFNGDANGAYNIARKGILILKAIKKSKEKPNLYISNTDWDNFAQRKK